MVNFLETLFDASIPGQRINAAREQRANRIAAKEQREREAAAFESIQSGDVLGAAAQSPEIAAKFQQVQQGQNAFDSEQEQQQSQAFRQSGLRATRALKSLTEAGVPIEQAFDRVSQSAGNLFGSPEELAQIKEFVTQGGPGALASIEAAFGETPSNKGRFISTRGGIFDTQTQKIIANQDPLNDLKRRQLESNIDATEALAEQRRAKTGVSGNVPVTKGQEALDKAFAKDAVDFLQGGNSVAASNIARLDNAIDVLREENITGPLAGIGDVNVRSITNPRSAAIQQQVQNAIQSSLKATLGAQFARVEGEQLLDRAFAPRQSEAENIRRVKIVADTMRDMLERKQVMTDYFLENGSLAGFDGEPPDPEVFNAILDQFEEEDDAAEAVDDGISKLSPEKQQRIKELRASKAAGTLQ